MRNSRQLTKACERAAEVLDQLAMPIEDLMATKPPPVDRWLWRVERDEMQAALQAVTYWLQKRSRRPARRRRRSAWSAAGRGKR